MRRVSRRYFSGHSKSYGGLQTLWPTSVLGHYGSNRVRGLRRLRVGRQRRHVVRRDAHLAAAAARPLPLAAVPPVERGSIAVEVELDDRDHPRLLLRVVVDVHLSQRGGGRCHQWLCFLAMPFAVCCEVLRLPTRVDASSSCPDR